MKTIEKIKKWITIIIFICGLLIISLPLLDYVKTKDSVDILIIIILILIIFLLLTILKGLVMIIEKFLNKNPIEDSIKKNNKAQKNDVVKGYFDIVDNRQFTISKRKGELHEEPILVDDSLELYNKRDENASVPGFPSWYISLSFGKSNSNNYGKAVELAKSAPTYLETNPDGNIIHQAIYSNNSKEYLQFIKLYELVKNWKSSFVIINGEHIDRKIVGQLNYCYGDKCRSGNPSFCYGASYMTENPFGCHRLQISACNHPWWEFYRKVKGKWILDKNAMMERINSYASIYNICPDFDYDNIMRVFNKFPKSISDSRYKKLRAQNESPFTVQLKI